MAVHQRSTKSALGFRIRFSESESCCLGFSGRQTIMASRNSPPVIRSVEPRHVASLAEHSLVERSKKGSHSAFSLLIERNSRTALGAIRKIVRNHADAEDVFQESAMKAYHHINSFDGRSSFSTWFTRISINTALMLIRKRTARPEMSLEVDFSEGRSSQYPIVDRAPDPEQCAIRRQNLEGLHTAIRRLPTILRESIERRYLLEISNVQVEAAFGISVPATKSRLLRARRRMRVSLTSAQAGDVDSSAAN
jgi:RNA polymerase sigma-70 factor (ECF subfamily)